MNVEEIFQILSNNYPEPKTELVYTNHFTLLVAIILSAQATDKGVNLATKNLFEIISTPQDLLFLGEEQLKTYIKTIGLYNSKAKNIMLLAKILSEKYNGSIPNNFAELIELPGVGRKTANVFLNCAHGHETIAVDTHVFRVSNRIFAWKCTKPEQTELRLLQIVPKNYLKIAHHLLILHGRYICQARRPKCESCNIKHLCKFYRSNKE